jgi:hypothetical protein
MKKKIIKPSRTKLPALNDSEINFIYDICAWFAGKKNQIPGPQGIRYPLLFDYLRKNGCTGAAFKFLEETNFPAPAEFRQRCLDEYLAHEMVNTVFMGTAARVADLCGQSGINYVMMKGVALLRSIYGDQAVRPLSDIDLIVENREAAELLTGRLQGRTQEGITFTSRRYKDYGRINCDVYDESLGREIEVEIYFPVDESTNPMIELFFKHSRRLFSSSGEKGAGELAAPDPTLHFLVLLIHLVHHHLGARLIWHLDIALLVARYGDDLDWEMIVGECKRMQFKDALFNILLTLKTRFLVDIPGEVLSEAGRRPGYNYGMLKAMAAPPNVIMDSFGGGKLWQYPELSLKKLNTLIMYIFYPFLLNDQPHRWYTFNLGNRRRKRLIGELASMTLFAHRYMGRGVMFKRAAGVVFSFLMSLLTLPLHVYFNTAKGKQKTI